MTQTERQERGALHTEWLDFLHYALRSGSTQERAVQIADVLTYGQTLDKKQLDRVDSKQ